MNDEELVKHCMCGCMYLEAECPNCNKVTDADRIEELEWLRDALVKKVQGLTNLLDDQFGTPCEQIRHKQEIEALTEQLEAARADAKEAEAYAEELEKDRNHWQDVAGREGVCMTCRGPKGAPEPYGCSDCFNTGYCGEWHNEMGELREKLAKAVAAVRMADTALYEAEAILGGEYGDFYGPLCEDIFKLRTTLAEIEGEKG